MVVDVKISCTCPVAAFRVFCLLRGDMDYLWKLLPTNTYNCKSSPDSASAERTFITLRHLKTYLCNTMSDTRLIGLALMNIHHVNNIDSEKLLRQFNAAGIVFLFSLFNVITNK
ncbi:hypothetical protein GOODEAATRI_029236 [Goodea atripinnis]|uniref:Uncharacterized protein n=1 Tax=Goodea atripinnis TaxID=208336 RepID=A0ABV0NRK2_9TELE